MKQIGQPLLSVLLIAASAVIAVAQDRGQRNGQQGQFNEHDQQVAHEWYNKRQSNPPAGFRNSDRLSSDQESHLREGAVLDRDLRGRVHPAPRDLSRQLSPPPPNHRYVGIGNHVALIDNGYHVKAVIHLHNDH